MYKYINKIYRFNREQNLLKTPNLCDFVHTYLSDRSVSDMNVRKHWKDFLKQEGEEL